MTKAETEIQDKIEEFSNSSDKDNRKKKLVEPNYTRKNSKKQIKPEEKISILVTITGRNKDKRKNVPIEGKMNEDVEYTRTL